MDGRQWAITEVVNRENLDVILAYLRRYPSYKEEGWVDRSEDEPFPYFFCCLCFSVCVFVWERYLDALQIAQFRRKDHETPFVKEGMKTSVFLKTLSYGEDKLSLDMLESGVTFCWGTFLLFAGGLPYAWQATFYMTTTLGIVSSSSGVLFQEIMRTSCLIVFFIIHDTLIALPFSIYRTFVIEEKHGFNKTTFGLFLKDKVLSVFLSIFIGVPVMGGIVWLARTVGGNFALYAWGFMLVVSLVMMTIYPVFIAPLFNKYEELPDGKLRSAIYELAGRCEFPLKQLFTIDGSKRSSHSNAFMYGFGKSKMIVLFDTLLTQVNEDEVLAILAHEIGHWRLYHTVQAFIISNMYTFALFSSFTYMQSNASLFSAFGLKLTGESPAPVLLGLLLFTQTYWAPVDKLLQFLLNMNSRRNEFQADQYSKDLGMGKELASGLIKISIENFNNLVPDPWYSAWHFSHPPVVERCRAMIAPMTLSKAKEDDKID